VPVDPCGDYYPSGLYVHAPLRWLVIQFYENTMSANIMCSESRRDRHAVGVQINIWWDPGVNLMGPTCMLTLTIGR